MGGREGGKSGKGSAIIGGDGFTKWNQRQLTRKRGAMGPSSNRLAMNEGCTGMVTYIQEGAKPKPVSDTEHSKSSING